MDGAVNTALSIRQTWCCSLGPFFLERRGMLSIRPGIIDWHGRELGRRTFAFGGTKARGAKRQGNGVYGRCSLDFFFLSPTCCLGVATRLQGLYFVWERGKSESSLACNYCV